AVKAHGVIDAQGARMAQNGFVGTPDGLETARGDLRRRNGCKPPFLAGGIEHVRRGADLRADDGKRTVAPDGRPIRGGADRKVEIKADAHARIPQPTSGFSKLLVRYPLQPEQKAHLVPILAGKGRNAIAVRILKFFRPAVPARTSTEAGHLEADRLEERIEAERVAGPFDERIEPVAMRLLHAGKTPPQDSELVAGHRLIVDELALKIGKRRFIAVLRRIEAIHLIDRDIKRVQAFPDAWRKRASPFRSGQEQSVQRVHAKKIGAHARGHFSQPRQILEITDSAVPAGAERIKLAGDAPGSAAVQKIRKI